MPWKKARNHVGCPASKPWAVVKDNEARTLVSCHDTEDSANKKLAALYANEPEAG